MVEKKPLGQGGFGVVFKGYVPGREHDEVAIKLMKHPDPAFQKEAQREYEILKPLKHQHIVNSIEAFEHNGSFCAVSEYANAGDLKKLIKKQDSASVPWSVFEIVEYFVQIVSGIHTSTDKLLVILQKNMSKVVPLLVTNALAYALVSLVLGMAFLHDRKIMHRDIKPANIVVHRPPGSVSIPASLTRNEKKTKLRAASEQAPVDVQFQEFEDDFDSHWVSGKVVSHARKLQQKHTVYTVVVGKKTFKKKIDELIVMTSAAFVLKIADFGLAKAMDDNKESAVTRCGTEVYMSPEMLKRGGYSFANDLWALGCVLFELWYLLKHILKKEHIA